MLSLGILMQRSYQSNTLFWKSVTSGLIFGFEIFLNNQKKIRILWFAIHTYTEICMMRQYFHLSYILVWNRTDFFFFFHTAFSFLSFFPPKPCMEYFQHFVWWNLSLNPTVLLLTVLDMLVRTHCNGRSLPQLAGYDKFLCIIMNVNSSTLWNVCLHV